MEKIIDAGLLLYAMLVPLLLVWMFLTAVTVSCHA